MLYDISEHYPIYLTVSKTISTLFRMINHLYIYGQYMTLFRLLLWLVCLEQGSSQGCIEYLHTVVFC